jgi:hypothetical protein
MKVTIDKNHPLSIVMSCGLFTISLVLAQKQVLDLVLGDIVQDHEP